jgi:hypothetical protein
MMSTILMALLSKMASRGSKGQGVSKLIDYTGLSGNDVAGIGNGDSSGDAKVDVSTLTDEQKKKLMEMLGK